MAIPGDADMRSLDFTALASEDPSPAIFGSSSKFRRQHSRAKQKHSGKVEEYDAEDGVNAATLGSAC